jgi:hypothetical protein
MMMMMMMSVCVRVCVLPDHVSHQSTSLMVLRLHDHVLPSGVFEARSLFQLCV